MTNMDKLYEAVEARGPVCVGLDTDFSYLPADFVDSTLTKGENIVRFNKKLIDATKAVAGCYKVQIAYYESLGMEGMKAYADTLKAVREAGVPVIADIKRGDIAKTAEMYAMGHFTGDFDDEFIYEEIDRKIEDRHKPMIALMRDEALGAFRMWEENAEKTEY
jgi:orotidine-5'-phosphate decarboxylase